MLILSVGPGGRPRPLSVAVRVSSALPGRPRPPSLAVHVPSGLPDRPRRPSLAVRASSGMPGRPRPLSLAVRVSSGLPGRPRPPSLAVLVSSGLPDRPRPRDSSFRRDLVAFPQIHGGNLPSPGLQTKACPRMRHRPQPSRVAVCNAPGVLHPLSQELPGNHAGSRGPLPSFPAHTGSSQLLCLPCLATPQPAPIFLRPDRLKSASFQNGLVDSAQDKQNASCGGGRGDPECFRKRSRFVAAGTAAPVISAPARPSTPTCAAGW